MPVSTITVNAQSGYLPIYSDPVPHGYRIMNTPGGKHDSGWTYGMAGTTVPDTGVYRRILTCYKNETLKPKSK